MRLILTAIGTSLCIAFTLVAPSLVVAQNADAPAFSVGDKWKRTNGVAFEVLNVTADTSVMKMTTRACADCLLTLSKDFTAVNYTSASGAAIEPTQVPGALFIGPAWKFFDWPLAVGKTWMISTSGYFRGSPYPYTVDIKVHSVESVKTKAGTFKAYRLVHNWAVKDAFRTTTWTNQLWYAPDVKNYVKFVTTSNAPEWELESYSVK